jgi:hypothetical protein
VKLRFIEPEIFGASELTYKKFSLNELRAKQLHETRVTGCRYFTQSFARFSSSLIRKVFKPNIFEFSKQPNKN